jgi:hypothetical protein
LTSERNRQCWGSSVWFKDKRAPLLSLMAVPPHPDENVAGSRIIATASA